MNKQVLCETCVHKEVCGFQEEYSHVSDSIWNSHVNIPSGDRHTIKPLSNFTWLNEVAIYCKHYIKNSSAVKR